MTDASWLRAVQIIGSWALDIAFCAVVCLICMVAYGYAVMTIQNMRAAKNRRGDDELGYILSRRTDSRHGGWE